MIRPLYKAASREPESPEPEGNAGLWFDKFCNRWHDAGDSWTMSSRENNPKLEWLKTLDRVGAQDQIGEYCLRLMRLISRSNGRAAMFAAKTRFVTGLGRSHPVENGFTWHPTLGIPYLPGSSVKGLVRSWAEADAEPSPAEETLVRLFGAPGRVGGICFLDAVPVALVQLETDVMTPHYAGWDKSDPPADWRSPNPIPFLTTSAKTPFLFGIVPRGTVSDDDLCTVSDWLRLALEWSGAGAKTAVGYGRFEYEEAKTEHWIQRVRDEETMRTPEGQWRLKLRDLSEAGILDLVRVNLERNPLEDTVEKRAFVQAVLSTGYVQHWRQGRKREPETNVGKRKLKERARLLDNVADELGSGRT